jgi:hypothetical protein
MEEGSILVTFNALELGPSRQEVNALRVKAGYSPSPDAACYDMERIILGQARHVVSWSEGGGNYNPITIYKYTRVVQTARQDSANDGIGNNNNTHSAVLMCSDP